MCLGIWILKKRKWNAMNKGVRDIKECYRFRQVSRTWFEPAIEKTEKRLIKRRMTGHSIVAGKEERKCSPPKL
jgi:hypothetical protein